MCLNIKCNFCGKEMDEFDIMSGFTISKKIGYGSIHDGEEVDLKLCCACFDRVTHACVIDPFIRVFDVVLAENGESNAS